MFYSAPILLVNLRLKLGGASKQDNFVSNYPKSRIFEQETQMYNIFAVFAKFEIVVYRATSLGTWRTYCRKQAM